MRFTMSKDGKERCTVNLRTRLTREEWELVANRAKELTQRGDTTTPHELLSCEAGLAVEDYLCRLKDKDPATCL